MIIESLDSAVFESWSKEKENLDSIIIPYGLKVFVQTMRPELVPQLKLISTTLSVTMKQTALNFF